MLRCLCYFLNDPATTEIYTYCHSLSLHDALPISIDFGIDVMRRVGERQAYLEVLGPEHTLHANCGIKDIGQRFQRDIKGAIGISLQIGEAHVRTPVTNAHPVCRPLLETKKTSLR